MGNVIAVLQLPHFAFVVVDSALSCQNTVRNSRFDVYVNNDETSILQGGTKMADKEVLVVASKVKAYINKQMMTSSDAITALSDKVCVILDEAVERAKANRRSTVMAQDP